MLVSEKGGLESVTFFLRNSNQVRALRLELPTLIQGPNPRGQDENGAKDFCGG